MSKTGSHKIRPAGRLVLTIGRDLIQDSYAAVVELVKNAYDADSPDVNIEFSRVRQQGGYSIAITDHGHGMTREGRHQQMDGAINIGQAQEAEESFWQGYAGT